MLKRTIKTVVSIALVVSMLFSAATVSGFAAPEKLPNNAEAIVPRGSDAFEKSSYEFNAKWIWSETDNGARNRWMAFRKDISLDKVPEKVTAKIAADSKYWLYINGELAVFDGQLKRGAALLKKDIYPTGSTAQPNLSQMIQEVATYFDEVDITPYLKEGENTIVALVWYFGNEGHSHVGSGKGAFLFESKMNDNLIISDSSWKVSRHMGYQPSAQISGYAQEYQIVYDARNGFNDFYKPEFDVSSWANAKEIGNAGDKPWNELWPRTIPEWKLSDLYTFKTNDPLVSKSGTTYTLSLPTNIQFTPYIKVKAQAGKQIVISCPNSGNTSVTYTTMGGQNGEAIEQEYESPSWMNWWFIRFNIPNDVEIIDIGYRESGYKTDFLGYFNSDDNFFNTLWRKARDTVYVNIRDTFMDCPDRERTAWLGDAVNEMEIAYYSMSPTVFDAVRKDISVRINWQNAEGSIPTTAPATFRHNEYAELTAQSLAGVMSWFKYYLNSGDKTTLEIAYPSLQKYMDMFKLEEQNYTVPHMRGAGVNTVHQWWIDWGGNIDKDLCENIWSYIGVLTLVDFARELGDTANLARYEKLRDQMKAKFDLTFWNGKEYRSTTYTGPADDRGQALAVYAGLVSPDKYPIIKDILLKNKFASPYMVKYSIEALYLMGYPDAAEQRMKESYANDVPLSDPTFSEGWGGGGTKNHGWSGGGLITLSGYAAGVRPLEPAYTKFIVAPQMASIKSIDAGVPTINGVINVKARNAANKFDLTVNVPDGSVGLIGIPRLKTDTAVKCGDIIVWDNGVVKSSVPGLEYSHTDFSHIYFNAQPADWTFSAVPSEKVVAEKYFLNIPMIANGSVLINGNHVELPYTSQFNAGEVVTIKAIPNSDYIFESFFGSIGSRDKEITLTMDSDKSISASFVKEYKFEGFKLTVESTDNYAGILSVNGSRISTPYGNLVEKNEELTVKATAKSSDYTFLCWRDATGKIISYEPEITIIMDADKTVKAEFFSNLGPNLARGKKATASTSIETSMFGVNKVTDGIYTVRNSNEGWTTNELLTTQWIYIDLGEVTEFETVKIYPRYDGTNDGYGIPITMLIQVSNNATDWTTVFTARNPERPTVDPLVYKVGTQQARYIRLYSEDIRPIPTDGNKKRIQISEIEIYNSAVMESPKITTQPADIRYRVNADVKFSIASTGSAPLMYQWQVSSNNGETWLDIEGAYNNVLNLTTSFSNSGNKYRCVVSNTVGTITSKEVVLNVLGYNYALKQPAECSSNQIVGTRFMLANLNDGKTDLTLDVYEGWTSAPNNGKSSEWVSVDIGTPKVINKLVIYPRINGRDDGYGIPEDFNVQVSLDGNTWTTVYSKTGFERPLVKVMDIDFEPVLAKYVKFEGTKLRANPYDANQIRMQILEFEVYNYPPTGPVIESQPTDATVDVNTNATFAVSAIGGDNLSYQWEVSNDGESFDAIAGATSNSLTVPASFESNGFEYRCALTDEFGTIYTNIVKLNVLAVNPVYSLSVDKNALDSDDVVTAKAGITNYSGKDVSVRLVIALYDNDGKLENIAMKNKTFGIGQSELDISLTLPSDVNGKTLCAFLWDGNTFVPLTKVITIK